MQAQALTSRSVQRIVPTIRTLEGGRGFFGRGRAPRRVARRPPRDGAFS